MMKLRAFAFFTPLLLLSTITHAAPAPGGGAYFYSWNANEYCNASSCPEKWTKTIADVNAKIPAGTKGKITYIYLNSLTVDTAALNNLSSTQAVSVGGCGSGAVVTYCSLTNLPYVPADKKKLNGPVATAQLLSDFKSLDPSTTYHIVPMLSNGDGGLSSASTAQIQKLALALSCLVSDGSQTAKGFSCSDSLTGSIKSADPSIDGLGFDIEPAISTANASTFYPALAKDIGDSSKVVMFSRGPNGLSGLVPALQASLKDSSTAQFIFAPQIYDFCSGMQSWACPIATPIPLTGSSVGSKAYAQYFFSQMLPSENFDGNSWSSQALGIKDMSMGIQLWREIWKPFGLQVNGDSYQAGSLYGIPVQPIMSGGGSTQIWSHVNLYKNGNPKDVYQNTGSLTNMDQIYGDPKPCQRENPDGSLGATIQNCVTYQNPYHSGIADYAAAFFNALRYWVSDNNPLSSNPIDNSAAKNSLVGVGIYPFTPYGFFDKQCIGKSNTCYGYFPEVPDGLVNGQKPKFSFWKAYVRQFANQKYVLPSSAGPQKSMQFSLPSSYFTLAGSTASVSFQATSASVQPTGYRAGLIDALGKVVASSTSCVPSSCLITKVPAGNHVLKLEAMNGQQVMGSIEAAAVGSVAPPPPGPVQVTNPLGTASNGLANITWDYIGTETGLQGFTLVFNSPSGLTLKETAPLSDCQGNSCQYALPVGLLPVVGNYSVSLYPNPNNQGAHGVKTPLFPVTASLPVKLENVTAHQATPAGSVKLSWTFTGGSPGVNQYQVLLYSRSDSGFHYKQDADLLNSCVGSRCSTTVPVEAFSAGPGTYFGTIYAQTTPAGSSPAGKSSIPDFNVSEN